MEHIRYNYWLKPEIDPCTILFFLLGSWFSVNTLHWFIAYSTPSYLACDDCFLIRDRDQRRKKQLKTCMLLSALLRRGCLIKYRNKPIDLIAFNLYMRVFVAIDQGIHHTHARVCAYIFFFTRRPFEKCTYYAIKWTQNSKYLHFLCTQRVSGVCVKTVYYSYAACAWFSHCS